ncbi:hypothetical protein [Azospirillum sp. SYSU D00513]|uniref:hypothetical protein n=1 Tax=Azospirillum sp. SYSU D00513 TaxID=2812561 RepID=UPI001A977397|nr:hypothetical protein [Azospirillum sp. SYSU D00513]
MTAIPTPARSVFETSPERLHPFLKSLSDRVVDGPNWLVRKKTVCDLMLGLDAFFALPAAERRAMLNETAEESPDSEQGPGDFRRVLPLYVAAILEGLKEERISGAEQAAVYLLSLHPEHKEAAEQWMLADPRNAKAVRKIMRTDRRYAQLSKRMAGHWQEMLRKGFATEGGAQGA